MNFKKSIEGLEERADGSSRKEKKVSEEKEEKSKRLPWKTRSEQNADAGALFEP